MERTFVWPDQIQGAVSLTYDDGLPVHYTVVAPLLRHYGLHATFYPMIESDLRLHPDQWRQLAADGHELGNHSIFHPCRQSQSAPYPWLDARYDLRNYTPAHLRAELEVANLVLQLLDGRTERSYGNTCCDYSVGHGGQEQSVEPVLKELFIAARGALTNRIAQPAQRLDLFNVGCISADGRSLEDLTHFVEETRACGGWAVLMIHGIGATTHELNVDRQVHEQFIGWLTQQRTIWTAPVRTIAAYIRQQVAVPRVA